MKRLLFVMLVGILSYVGSIYFYTVTNTYGLKYATSNKKIVLETARSLHVTRGAFDTTYSYKLEKGIYSPVLESKNGTFYLSPKSGFYQQKSNSSNNGYGVGGIYLPNDSANAYVWSLAMGNENRTINSPSTIRTLNSNFDQREWQLLSDKNWYIETKFDLNTFIFIDQDFILPQKDFALRI